MAFLLDTNVLSESTKPSPAPEVLEWLADHSEQSFVSTISLGEIWKGIESLPDGRRRQKFENWMLVLEADYETQFVVPDQSVDVPMAAWADIWQTWLPWCWNSNPCQS